MKDETDQRAAEIDKALPMLNDACKERNTEEAMFFGGIKALSKNPIERIGGGFWVDVYNEHHGSFLAALMASGVQSALKTGMFYFLHHFCVFTPINTRLKLVPVNRGKKRVDNIR